MSQQLKYTPQYKQRGITPMKIPQQQVAPNVDPSTFNMAFASKRRPQPEQPIIPVPYAEVGQPRKISQMLNVGNNYDSNWLGVENVPTNIFETVVNDDMIDPNQPMIDNNDYVYPMQTPHPTEPNRPPMRVVHNTNFQLNPPKPNSQSKSLPDVGEYMLLVDGNIVSIGDAKQIQEMAWELLIQSESMPSDIVVLKRVIMNVGVFLGE
jgi:hypothetical protein